MLLLTNLSALGSVEGLTPIASRSSFAVMISFRENMSTILAMSAIGMSANGFLKYVID